VAAEKLIAIVLPNLAGGGVERVRLLLAEQFLAQGYAVDLVLAQGRGELIDEVPSGCRLISLDAPRLLAVPWRLSHYVRRERPDAMLAAMWPLSGLAGLALRLAGSDIPLIVSEHSDLRRMQSIKPLERPLLKLFGPWFYARAGKVVAVSRGVKDSLVETARLAPGSIEVIHNPVRQSGPDKPDSADDALLEWWGEAGAVRLISVGSLKPAKDYPTLIRALGRIREDREARLIILGEGPERASLEALTRSERLAEAVRFPGFRAEPYPLLNQADLFVLSSRWEGLGNAITEALLCGCRVVATDCQSGPSELLADGRYGTLVPVADPKALAKAVIEALDRPHDPATGIAWASQFSPDATARAYLKLLLPGSTSGLRQ
jgi:glycosyltransferase involved in cell wall biosynthesis